MLAQLSTPIILLFLTQFWSSFSSFKVPTLHTYFEGFPRLWFLHFYCSQKAFVAYFLKIPSYTVGCSMHTRAHAHTRNVKGLDQIGFKCPKPKKSTKTCLTRPLHYHSSSPSPSACSSIGLNWLLYPFNFCCHGLLYCYDLMSSIITKLYFVLWLSLFRDIWEREMSLWPLR